MHLLVTYGTKLGGTVDIAESIGRELSSHGYGVTVAPAVDLIAPAGFDAVIVGGSLYRGRWSRQARHYIRRYSSQLRTKPVWLFSSGPLDDSALRGIPPTARVAHAMLRVNARGHVTFGGRLEPDAKGILPRTMAKTKAGDWRNAEHIARWAAQIAEELRSSVAA